MRKIMTVFLALALVMGMAGCTRGSTGGENGKAPESALEILQTVWNLYDASEKEFMPMGGDAANAVTGAPGNHDLQDEGLVSNLLVPAEQVANLDSAASLVNGQMLNYLVIGAYKVKTDAKAFAKAMQKSISEARWICAPPEKMLIAVISDNYVVACFGIEGFTGPFETHFKAAYPQAEILYDEYL